MSQVSFNTVFSLNGVFNSILVSIVTQAVIVSCKRTRSAVRITQGIILTITEPGPRKDCSPIELTSSPGRHLFV